jgi:hypothetical protein
VLGRCVGLVRDRILDQIVFAGLLFSDNHLRISDLGGGTLLCTGTVDLLITFVLFLPEAESERLVGFSSA